MGGIQGRPHLLLCSMVLDRQSIYLFYLCGEGDGESQTRACLGWRLNRFISLERVGERDHVCQLLPQDGAQGGTPPHHYNHIYLSIEGARWEVDYCQLNTINMFCMYIYCTM
jgi:hypothetical protein